MYYMTITVTTRQNNLLCELYNVFIVILQPRGWIVTMQKSVIKTNIKSIQTTVHMVM